MATKNGTNASVKIGDLLVADMASWSFDDNRPAITAPIFGDTDQKVHGLGTRTVSGSISGFLNTEDSTGQSVIQLAYENGTALTDFRLYIDDTDYYTGEEVWVTSSNKSASPGAVIPVAFNFTVSGNWTLTEG